MKGYKRCAIDKMSCLFCQRKDELLHEFRTLDADETVRHMATELQETELISRMEGGGLIAIDAKYIPSSVLNRNKKPLSISGAST